MATNKTRKEIIGEVTAFLKNMYGEPQSKKGLPKCIDIHCKKDGIDTYFCVMAVSLNKRAVEYFDATVSSEWEFIKCHEKDNNRVVFVIYRKDIEDPDKRIVLLTPEQVLKCSRPSPSFQIKFFANSSVLEKPSLLTAKKGLDRQRLYGAIDSFNSIKNQL